jgi:hypothetical protein
VGFSQWTMARGWGTRRGVKVGHDGAASMALDGVAHQR